MDQNVILFIPINQTNVIRFHVTLETDILFPQFQIHHCYKWSFNESIFYTSLSFWLKIKCFWIARDHFLAWHLTLEQKLSHKRFKLHRHNKLMSLPTANLLNWKVTVLLVFKSNEEKCIDFRIKEKSPRDFIAKQFFSHLEA